MARYRFGEEHAPRFLNSRERNVMRTNRTARPVSRFLLALAVVLAMATGASRAAQAGLITGRCMVNNVTVWGNVIFVACLTVAAVDPAPSSTNVSFFAVATSDSAQANRFMTVATSALISGRRFAATFTSGDTSGTSLGCLATDCRKAVAFGIE
jgi:hypothetical protein